jgi:hypothetical protein
MVSGDEFLALALLPAPWELCFELLQTAHTHHDA